MEEEELYKRHDGIGLHVPDEVFIVGCGGTGTHTAILCAMIGVKTIHLSDDDIIEIHNLNRLPFTQEAIGEKKTEVIKQYIANIRPSCEVITYEGMHSESDLLALMPDIIFDCNDDQRMQEKIFAFCKKRGKKYVGVGCNADHITIKSHIDKLWGDGSGDRYTATPIFIIPPMIAACCAVWHVVKGHSKIDVLNNLKYMFTSPISEGQHPEECMECPLIDNCSGCVEHNLNEYEPCTHCPVQHS